MHELVMDRNVIPQLRPLSEGATPSCGHTVDSSMAPNVLLTLNPARHGGIFRQSDMALRSSQRGLQQGGGPKPPHGVPARLFQRGQSDDRIVEGGAAP